MDRRSAAIALCGAIAVSAVAGCAGMMGISSQQQQQLEAHLTGKDVWLKRDIATDTHEFGTSPRVLLAGTHVRILSVNYAPAVMLTLQTGAGTTYKYNTTPNGYTESGFNETISSSFAFSRDELGETFATYSFSFERADSGALRWVQPGINVDLDIPNNWTVKLTVENTGAEPLVIDWGYSSLVGLDGQSHKLVPGSTRKKNVGTAVTPTMVPPQARMTEYILPEDMIDLTSDKTPEVFPSAKGQQGMVGARASIVLGVRRGSSLSYVTCSFRVKGILRSMQLPPGADQSRD